MKENLKKREWTFSDVYGCYQRKKKLFIYQKRREEESKREKEQEIRGEPGDVNLMIPMEFFLFVP